MTIPVFVGPVDFSDKKTRWKVPAEYKHIWLKPKAARTPEEKTIFKAFLRARKLAKKAWRKANREQHPRSYLPVPGSVALKIKKQSKRREVRILMESRQRMLSKRRTRHEVAVGAALSRLYIPYNAQIMYMTAKTHGRVVDFQIYRDKIFLEIDGPDHQSKKWADEQREKELIKRRPGYTFLRITNKEIDAHKEDLDDFLFNAIWQHKKQRFANRQLATDGVSKTKLESLSPTEATVGQGVSHTPTPRRQTRIFSGTLERSDARASIGLVSNVSLSPLPVQKLNVFERTDESGARA